MFSRSLRTYLSSISCTLQKWFPASHNIFYVLNIMELNVEGAMPSSFVIATQDNLGYEFTL
jgi:hypothetical protein